MAKIFAPNKSYSGISASVPFCQGVGETDSPYLLEWFKEHGYTVDGEEVKAVEEVEEVESAVEVEVKEEVEKVEKTLEDMTKEELKDIADNVSVPYNSRTSKEDLIAALKAKGC